MTERSATIFESVVEGRRLGRHLEHDERSKNFLAEQAAILYSVTHKRHHGAFDQGQLGSCTGNAATGVLDTDPWTHHLLGERTAVKVYELATTLDSVAGAYPPDDTGSTGLAACKAMKELGYISSYGHAFGMQQALKALVMAPVMIGINWYDSMDEPTAHGELVISPDAQVRGGHEIEVNSIDINVQTIGGWNSWGPLWGPLDGAWIMSWSTFDRLLSEQGDVTVPVR